MIKTKRNRIGNVALLTGILTCLICWQNSYLLAQQKVEEETSDKPVELRAPSVTEQTITVDGKSINYTATVGYMIQTDADGKTIGYFFGSPVVSGDLICVGGHGLWTLPRLWKTPETPGERGV